MSRRISLDAAGPSRPPNVDFGPAVVTTFGQMSDKKKRMMAILSREKEMEQDSLLSSLHDPIYQSMHSQAAKKTVCPLEQPGTRLKLSEYLKQIEEEEVTEDARENDDVNVPSTNPVVEPTLSMRIRPALNVSMRHGSAQDRSLAESRYVKKMNASFATVGKWQQDAFSVFSSCSSNSSVNVLGASRQNNAGVPACVPACVPVCVPAERARKRAIEYLETIAVTSGPATTGTERRMVDYSLLTGLNLTPLTAAGNAPVFRVPRCRPLAHVEVIVRKVKRWYFYVKDSRFFIQGRCADESGKIRLWTSGVLGTYRRITSHSLEALSGARLIVLEAFSPRNPKVETVHPEYICNAFCQGFPERWIQDLELWLDFLNKGEPKDFTWPDPRSDVDCTSVFDESEVDSQLASASNIVVTTVPSILETNRLSRSNRVDVPMPQVNRRVSLPEDKGFTLNKFLSGDSASGSVAQLSGYVSVVLNEMGSCQIDSQTHTSKGCPSESSSGLPTVSSRSSVSRSVARLNTTKRSLLKELCEKTPPGGRDSSYEPPSERSRSSSGCQPGLNTLADDIYSPQKFSLPGIMRARRPSENNEIIRLDNWRPCIFCDKDGVLGLYLKGDVIGAKDTVLETDHESPSLLGMKTKSWILVMTDDTCYRLLKPAPFSPSHGMPANLYSAFSRERLPITWRKHLMTWATWMAANKRKVPPNPREAITKSRCQSQGQEIQLAKEADGDVDCPLRGQSVKKARKAERKVQANPREATTKSRSRSQSQGQEIHLAKKADGDVDRPSKGQSVKKAREAQRKVQANPREATTNSRSRSQSQGQEIQLSKEADGDVVRPLRGQSVRKARNAERKVQPTTKSRIQGQGIQLSKEADGEEDRLLRGQSLRKARNAARKVQPTTKSRIQGQGISVRKAHGAETVDASSTALPCSRLDECQAEEFGRSSRGRIVKPVSAFWLTHGHSRAPAMTYEPRETSCYKRIRDDSPTSFKGKVKKKKLSKNENSNKKPNVVRGTTDNRSTRLPSETVENNVSVKRKSQLKRKKKVRKVVAPVEETRSEILARLVSLHEQPKPKRPTTKYVFARQEASAAYRKALAADGGDLFDDPLYANVLGEVTDDVECLDHVDTVLRGIETPSRCGTPACLRQDAFFHGMASTPPLTPFSKTVRSTEKERRELVTYHLQRQAEMKSLNRDAGERKEKAKPRPKMRELDNMLEQLTQKTLPKTGSVIPKFNPMNDSFNSDNEEKMNACLNDLSDSWT